MSSDDIVFADHHTEAATHHLNQLSGLIRRYDPFLYVLIREENASVGAEAIAHYYGISWSPDMKVLEFCKNARAAIENKHGVRLNEQFTLH